MKRLALITASLIGSLVLGACGGGAGSGGDDGTPPATAPAPTQTPDGSGGGGTPKPTGAPAVWTTGPVSVKHDVAVPPVPVLLRIRSAAHRDQGYDRIVFDFTGPLPGYTVRYVDEVREDPSDLPVTVPGRRFLKIVFTPAQAHTDNGATTVTPRTDRFDHPMLRGYAMAGDFEGYVTVALGLDDVVGFRIGELPGTPARIYLDVAA